MLKFVFPAAERKIKEIESQIRQNRIRTKKVEESKTKKTMLTILLALIVVGSGCTTSRTSTSTKPMNSEEIQQWVQNKTKDKERQEIAKAWEDAREQLRKQLQNEQKYPRTEEEREQVEAQLPESKPEDREWQIPQVKPIPTFTYLREFKPNNIQKGYDH